MTTKPKPYRPYDSTKDHFDKGDYEISVTKGHGFEGIETGKPKWHWSASLIYRTKTRKTVYILGDYVLRNRRKIWSVEENDAKDAAARQKAYDRLVPVLEKFRQYRATHRRRYELVREKNPSLPMIPETEE